MYYKFIDENNRGYNDFDYTEYLPCDGQPGKPLPTVEGEIEPCANGYHACKPQFVSRWIGAQLYEVKLTGTLVDGDDKTAASDIRIIRKVDAWNERTQRLFAVWCAREALKLVDNPDPRSIAACDVAERYANGDATEEELAAARDAAMDAARDAARDAAWAAARAAAWAAAWAAARDAAWAAARDAAWAAARDAAWAAAWDAAMDAARDAARDAQSAKLLEMCGEV